MSDEATEVEAAPHKQKKALNRVLSNISVEVDQSRRDASFGPPHLYVSGGFEDRGITQ